MARLCCKNYRQFSRSSCHMHSAFLSRLLKPQKTSRLRLRVKARQMACFHRHATDIQRIFRGFHVRKHCICMSDRKGFLRSAFQQGEVVKKLLMSNYRIQCLAQQETAEKTLRDQLDKWIDSKVHLVGTMQIKRVFDNTIAGGEEQNSFGNVLRAAQKKQGIMAKARMVLRRRIKELGGQVKTSKPVNVMRSGSYQSAYDRRIALQKIEDSKIINPEKFICQVGPRREKHTTTGLPFRLQRPYGHQKFLRKQEKLKYAAMYPKIVEAPWKVIFPSGQLFDKLYSL